MSVKATTPANVDFPPLANVRLDRTGRVFVDGREIPNSGVRLEIRPDNIAELTLTTPLFVLEGQQDVLEGNVTLLFIASIDPLTSVEGKGPTIPVALRDLADKIESGS